MLLLWHTQECLEKNNKRGITWKLRNRKQSFLSATRRPDVIYIPIKLLEDILNAYQIKGHNLETKKGKTIIPS